MRDDVSLLSRTLMNVTQESLIDGLALFML